MKLTIFFLKKFSSYFLLVLVLCSYSGFSQNVIKVDFETADEGYTPSGTEGSGYTDVFNRSNSSLSNVTNEDGEICSTNCYWNICYT